MFYFIIQLLLAAIIGLCAMTYYQKPNEIQNTLADIKNSINMKKVNTVYSLHLPVQAQDEPEQFIRRHTVYVPHLLVTYRAYDLESKQNELVHLWDMTSGEIYTNATKPTKTSGMDCILSTQDMDNDSYLIASILSKNGRPMSIDRLSDISQIDRQTILKCVSSDSKQEVFFFKEGKVRLCVNNASLPSFPTTEGISASSLTVYQHVNKNNIAEIKYPKLEIEKVYSKKIFGKIHKIKSSEIVYIPFTHFIVENQGIISEKTTMGF